MRALILHANLMRCLLAALLLWAGCRSADDRVRVRFWHAMGGESQRTLKAMVQRFERENPDVRIELVGMGSYDALAQKLMGAVAAQDPPSIAQMYENWTTQFLDGDRLVPLDSFVRGPDGLDERELADIYPALLENNSWQGRLVTLPFNKSVPVFYYNAAMFAAVGFDSFPATWSGFRAAANRLTRRGPGGAVETWGVAGGSDIWIFGSMLYQLGGRFLAGENGAPEFNSPAGVRALAFQAGLVLEDRVMKTDVGRAPMDDFLVGRVACLNGSSTWRAPILEDETFLVGMAPLPAWARPAAIVYGTNIGMFRDAKPLEQAAAWRFIRWFIAPEQQVEWSLGTWYVPIQRSCLEDPRIAERLAETPGLRAAYAQMDHAVFEPRGLKWMAGRKALVEELEAALHGARTPKQALDAAARRYAAGN
ncbi:MAG TPA: ABC transporter substrate-binding protein [candidate division WOR-3 bacterium]|uniref:ABC transporter substrate-binding protein n=1 Tax=candidate division WOR-3 bacterium TaxID=2052148 RepID=A0A7V0T4P0_UNCW3|nr:ABC transporter substrate-binding protein [candidate division WOR-3 bacterium]